MLMPYVFQQPLNTLIAALEQTLLDISLISEENIFENIFLVKW